MRALLVLASLTGLLIPTASNACTLMASQDMYIAWIGPWSGCTTLNACKAEEPIIFSVGSRGYDFGCGIHIFDWDFGDGSPLGHGMNPAHAYAAGHYPLKVTITNVAEKITVTSEITIQPNDEPNVAVIDDFRATPDHIVKGRPVTLTWHTHGATGTSVDPLSHSSSFLNDVLTIWPEATTTYTLTAHGKDASAVQSVTVDVAEPVCAKPPSPVSIRFNCPFTCLPGMFAFFEAVTPDEDTETCPLKFEWSFSNTQFGRYAVTRLGDCGTYREDLTVRNGLGTSPQASATVVVPVCGTASARISIFTATPQHITAGDKAVLYWSLLGPLNGISIQPGGHDSNLSTGTLEVHPLQTTTYTLTGYGAPATAGSSVTVTVDPQRRRAAGH